MKPPNFLMVSMKKIIIFYIFFQVFGRVCLFEGRQIRTPIRQNFHWIFPIDAFEQLGKSTL